MIDAARFGDDHKCSHGPGAVAGPGCPRVLLANLPAARMGDQAACPGGLSPIKSGCPTVLIGGLRAARKLDTTAHGGSIETGTPKVKIGQPRVDADGNLLPIPKGCEFLRRGHSAGSYITDDARFTRHKSPTMIGKGIPTMFAFPIAPPGDPSPQPAIVYPVIVRGKTIYVVAPADPVARKELPTIEQVADALGTLSDEQLARTEQVTLSPNPSPDDDDWRRRFNDPSFASGANAGYRIITFFPSGGRRDSTTTDAEMAHEAGHLLSESLWKDPAFKARWDAAMRNDPNTVSDYGDNNFKEDFAEACVIYSLTKGGPCEATAREMFPGRYAELDKLFPHGFPRKGGRQ